MVTNHPATPEEIRHTIIIDTRYIPVIEDARAWLESDKARYNAGEVVHLTLHLD